MTVELLKDINDKYSLLINGFTVGVAPRDYHTMCLIKEAIIEMLTNCEDFTVREIHGKGLVDETIKVSTLSLSILVRRAHNGTAQDTGDNN